MKPANVSEAEVQQRLARMRAGQPWTGLGAIVTVLGVMLLLIKDRLEGQGLSDTAVYAVVLALVAAGVVFQWIGWRKRKAFGTGGRS